MTVITTKEAALMLASHRVHHDPFNTLLEVRSMISSKLAAKISFHLDGLRAAAASFFNIKARREYFYAFGEGERTCVTRLFRAKNSLRNRFISEVAKYMLHMSRQRNT